MSSLSILFLFYGHILIKIYHSLVQVLNYLDTFLLLQVIQPSTQS